MRKFGFDNGIGTSFTHDIRFLEFPKFDYGEEVIESVSIPGRAGTLTVHTDKYTDTTIKNVFEFASDTLEDYERKLDAIKSWLRKSTKVSYTDKEDRYYCVKKVEISEEARKYGFFGVMTVIFTCDPFAYLKDGEYVHTIEQNATLYNPGIWCQPIYKVTGEGVCALTVNGKTMCANVAQNLTIDTGRMIAYREDGALVNASVTGEYEDLYLNAGENTIEITNGFTCKVTPNWRCL